MSREMKDSGIEWVGKIPREWKCSRLKDFYEFTKGKNAALYTQVYIGHNIGSFPLYSGQTENNGVMGLINSYDYDIEECLFTTTVGARVMTSKILKGKFSLSQNCLIMIQIKKCDNRLVFYILNPLFDFEKSLIPTYMQPSLRMSDLNRYQFYLPPQEEQKEIANYLDEKTSVIDNIITQTTLSIKEYKRYKQSVITEAVTKGINSDVEMKDSGIEWIGEIPKKWKIIKLKKKFKIIDGDRWKEYPNEEDWVDFGIPFLRTACLGGNIVNFQKSNFITKEKFNKLGQGKLKNNDIIISVRGSIGNASIYKSNKYKTAFINAQMMILRTSNNAEYYLYLIKSDWCVSILNLLSYGTAQKQLSNKILSEIAVICPPLQEQQQVADYLDKKCSDIDNLITQKQKLLIELEAYKKSLIYECVTGKREVIL